MTFAPHDEAPTKRGRARLWHGVFWLAALGASATIATGMHLLARSLHQEPVRWLGERADSFEHATRRVELSRMTGFEPMVLYFGDSTVTEYEPDSTLPRLTLTMLRRRHGHHRAAMASAAGPGSGVDQYSFYADRFAESEPDLVIWQISYFQFTDRWTSSNGAPELVGWVDSERLPDILALPYQELRLSLADVLLQQGIVRLGLHDLHRKVRKSQLRFAHLRELLEEAVNPNRGRSPEKRAQSMRGRQYGRRFLHQEIRRRYSVEGERTHFETTLEGLDPADVRLGLLRSGIEALHRHGVDVLVYLNPTNLDHLRTLGIEYEEGLARTRHEIRRTVEASGGDFLDLQGLLRDEDFADPAGHFVVDEENTAPLRISAAIAEAADEILQRRAATRPEEEPEGTP